MSVIYMLKKGTCCSLVMAFRLFCLFLALAALLMYICLTSLTNMCVERTSGLIKYLARSSLKVYGIKKLKKYILLLSKHPFLTEGGICMKGLLVLFCHIQTLNMNTAHLKNV